MTQYTLTNTCNCYDCASADCGYLTVSSDYEPKCSDCESNTTPADYCDGACYDYIVESIEYNLNKWSALVGKPTYIRIEGRNMGWENRSGYAIAQGTWESVYNKLRINGDFTLRVKFDGERFTVVRSSHDEPMGAYFTIVADFGVMED